MIFPENRQLFYVLEILDEAIGKKKKVEFTYNSYGTDRKMHPRVDAEGNPTITSAGYATIQYDYDLSESSRVEKYYRRVPRTESRIATSSFIMG